MVKFLIQTSGIYLLSVPGIGIVYASDFTAEVGDIHRFAYANQVISLAGTAPRKHQSGEVDKTNLPTSHKGKFIKLAFALMRNETLVSARK
ncbi:IS110 family transposase [Candidatus Poribacteria bacterium]